MGFLNRYDRWYTLKTTWHAAELLSAFDAKISEAKKDNSWFSNDRLGYKKIITSPNRILVKSSSIRFSQYTGLGTILVSMEEGADIKVRIIPMGAAREFLFWIGIISSLLMAAIMLWLVDSVYVWPLITILWGFQWAVFYLQIRYSRFKLFFYLKDILNDLNVKGDLIAIDRTLES